MEQNINKLGAFVAALALIASVLVMPSVSAGDEDLSVTLEKVRESKFWTK